MPLHLLGKKSWNVYNPAAIAKVKADEAAAAAQEEADDQRQQEYDAERRLAFLRGLPAPPPLEPTSVVLTPGEKREIWDDRHGRESRKRRRLIGEDDTDRDIRIAKDTVLPSSHDHQEDKRVIKHRRIDDAKITDHAGHIQLFAPPSVRDIRAEKNADVEAAKKLKEQELQDQYTLRFSNASGYRKDSKGVPWYAENGGINDSALDVHEDAIIKRRYVAPFQNDPKKSSVGRDAFGREDPHRPKRDAARIASADPMASMAAAQKRLKDIERERKAWRDERAKEIGELDKEERRKRRRRQRESRSRLDDDHGPA